MKGIINMKTLSALTTLLLAAVSASADVKLNPILKHFAIAGEDKKWAWADAVIDGKTVVVSNPAVPKPVAVRYAYTMSGDDCNLYNNEGLPASPFRTDDW